MTEYRVSWHIDVEAGSPEDAARHAREIQLNTDSIADVFEVTPHTVGVRGIALTNVIDLSELDGRSTS